MAHGRLKISVVSPHASALLDRIRKKGAALAHAAGAPFGPNSK